ncbi:MAG: DUF6519 domain-containing protein [Isosphaerales bacterium]
MKADLTKNTFNPFRHFDRVLMQQGRVQLDADSNEQAAIFLHYLRCLAADLIGPQGGPSADWGFGVASIPSTPSVPNDFRIGLGRYYVDGILCEADSRAVGFVVSTSKPNAIMVDQWTLDGAPFQVNQLVEVFDDVQLPDIPTGPPVAAAFAPTVVQISDVSQAQLTLTLPSGFTFGKPSAPKVRRVYTYLTQPDYPVPVAANLKPSSIYLIYLDVWERLITYVEDDAIREVALGGPDTTARAKVVWQVKTVLGRPNPDNKPPTTCENFQPADPNSVATLFGANRGRLKAMAKQTAASTDPCIIPPSASYTGPENQLYRVEIHRAGGVWDGTANGLTSAATFKWSRENGSVVFPISSGGLTTTVVLESLGRDDRFGLAEGEWVEIEDDTYVLQNHAETMLQVQSIVSSTLTVTLSGASIWGDPTEHPLLRRWDYQAGDPADGGLQLGSDNAALVIEDTDGKWLSLEDGVRIQFQPPDSGQPPTQYRTGDYWLIPARTATGDVEWPSEAEKDTQGNTVIVRIAKPPDGIDHHYAPLGIVAVAANGSVTLVSECRKKFIPAAP